jgi:hypothetical protein
MVNGFEKRTPLYRIWLCSSIIMHPHEYLDVWNSETRGAEILDSDSPVTGLTFLSFSDTCCFHIPDPQERILISLILDPSVTACTITGP